MWVEDEEDWYSCDTLTGHKSTVWGACFDATGDRMVSCGADLNLNLWRLIDDSSANSTADPRFVPEGPPHAGVEGVHTRCIYALDWSHVNNRIVSGGADDTLRVFTLAETVNQNGGGLVLEATLPRAHDLDVNGVAWSPTSVDTGCMLATCGDDETVKLWLYTPP